MIFLKTVTFSSKLSDRSTIIFNKFPRGGIKVDQNLVFGTHPAPAAHFFATVSYIVLYYGNVSYVFKKIVIKY